MNWYVLIGDDGWHHVATDDFIDEVRQNLANDKNVQTLGPMTYDEALRIARPANHEWRRKLNQRLIDLIF